MIQITEQQVLSLSPDDASIKAANGLAVPSRWLSLSFSDSALWGLCQGSGSKPYQVAIDLRQTAFKCSCPSRKFPCKHALALYLILARNPSSFSPELEPDWVSEWLNKRESNAKKKEEKAAATAPVDAAARERRSANRRQQTVAFLDDFENWARDIVRSGLVNFSSLAPSSISDMSRRLIDAKASGLASRLDFSDQSLLFSDVASSRTFLSALASSYTIAEAYRRYDNLSPDWQAEISALIGVTVRREEILAGTPVHDLWFVLGVAIAKNDNNMTTETYYLLGVNSGRKAQILNFIIQGSMSEQQFVPGYAYEADLCFYPGVSRFRATARSYTSVTDVSLPPQHSLEEALAEVRAEVSANPFSSPFMVADNLRLARTSDSFYVFDEDSNALPVSMEPESYDNLLAWTGGFPFLGLLIHLGNEWSVCVVTTHQPQPAI